MSEAVGDGDKGFTSPEPSLSPSATEHGVIRFQIPKLPPSCNAIYQIIFSQRRVEMKPEVRRWKSEAKLYVPAWKPDNPGYIRIDAVFGYPFFYKNGKVKRIDAPNLLKILIDAVAERLGFDDKMVKRGSWDSEHVEDGGWVNVTLSTRV